MGFGSIFASPAHILVARPLHVLIVAIFGLLSLVALAGGIVAIVWNAYTKTEFEFLGFHLTTGHVGVALVGIGLATAYFTFRGVLRNLERLGALPDESKEADAEKRQLTAEQVLAIDELLKKQKKPRKPKPPGSPLS